MEDILVEGVPRKVVYSVNGLLHKEWSDYQEFLKQMGKLVKIHFSRFAHDLS